MEIPTGYFIDTEELFRIQSEGYNAWSVDEKVVIFFHRVRKIIATLGQISLLRAVSVFNETTLISGSVGGGGEWSHICTLGTFLLCPLALIMRNYSNF